MQKSSPSSSSTFLLAARQFLKWMIFIKQQWLSTLLFSILFGLLFISWFPSQVYSLFDRCNERACLLRNAIPQRESWQCCKLYRIVVAQWGYWGCCLCSLLGTCLLGLERDNLQSQSANEQMSTTWSKQRIDTKEMYDDDC